MSEKRELVTFDTEDVKRAFIAQNVGEVRRYLHLPRVRTDAELEERLDAYFEYCTENGVAPTIEKMSLALGTTKRSVFDWETGREPGTGPRCQELIRRAKAVCEVYESTAAMEGKMNPVMYIFRAKNYYGMRDQQDVVVTPNTESRTREEILAEAELLPDT